jgi:hypothetical protein
MKKQLSLFVWAVAAFGMAPLMASANSGAYGASSADLTGAPGVRTTTKVSYEKYETRTSARTYEARPGKDIYYTQPAKRSEMYKSMDAGNTASSIARVSRSEASREAAKRKYYLAHPFFQPTKGKFGSVTDVSRIANSYSIATGFDTATYPNLAPHDDTGKWDMSRFSIKEDLSYGVTDSVSVLGMARFAASDYKFNWDKAVDDAMSESKDDLYGLGLQWRFVDNTDWIATFSGYYQHQADMSDTFTADIKAGYKVNKTTVYGLLRGWLVGFEGNAYGNGITNGDNVMFLAYNKTDAGDATYVEGGAGVFSVLDEDWTLNGEATFGNYDWHNQASLKAAIGWQPSSWWALNLYGKVAIHDSADDKNLDFYLKNESEGFADLTYVGTAKIRDNSETSFGLQGILYF